MGVFISKNGGTTWTSKRLCAVPGSCGSTAAVDPRNAKIVYVGGRRDNNAALYKSTNGGTTWTDVTKTIKDQIHEVAIDPKVANRVFVVTYDGIFRTTNGGTSWVHTREEYGYRVFAFHPTKPNTIYAGGSPGVLVSADGGTTWTALNAGLAVKDVRCLTFNRSTKVLYAGTAGGGVYKIQQ